MIKEFIFRLIQHLLGIFIFDAPVLNEIKRNIYKLFIKIGKKSYVAYDTYIVAPHSTKDAFLIIGNNVAIEHRCDIDYSGGLIIGDNTWISECAMIATHDHNIQTKSTKKSQQIRFSQLEIGEDVWVGAGAKILASVNKIGKGAIIGAGSIVTKDVEDFAVVVGNPAKTKRYRS